MARLRFETRCEGPPEAVFRFHERPDAMRLLTPWWSGARVVQPAASLRDGERAVIRLGLGPLRLDWVAEHAEYDPPRSFADVQVSGPFRAWRHTHRFLPVGGGTLLRDEVEYEAPGGLLAPLLDRLVVRPMLGRLFAYRNARTRAFTERV
jgi:ligand-binding SRPBCC domain-containing protein